MSVADRIALAPVAEVDAHEGPVHVAGEDALYFTTVPRPGAVVAIKRLDLGDGSVSVVRAPANMANGMALGHDGRLVVCEQGTRFTRARISSVDPATGDVATIVDACDGLPLNSPNDVVVKRDGTLWFTDPSYGWLQGFRPPPALADRVYRYDPRTAELTAVAGDALDKPNGLAFSPDERTLYVGDSGAPHRILAFDVRDGRHLTGRRVFAVVEPGVPDGIKVDPAGRVLSTCASGVQMRSAEGDLLEEIDLPGAVNLAFGGSAGDLLLITTDTAIWAAALTRTPHHLAEGA